MTIAAHLIVLIIVIVSVWGANIWKYLFLLFGASAALLVLRVSAEVEGRNEGFKDGVCFVYADLDAQDTITVKNLPEYCEQG